MHVATTTATTAATATTKKSSTTTGYLVVEGVVPCGMVVPPSFQQDGLEPLSPDSAQLAMWVGISAIHVTGSCYVGR